MIYTLVTYQHPHARHSIDDWKTSMGARITDWKTVGAHEVVAMDGGREFLLIFAIQEDDAEWLLKFLFADGSPMAYFKWLHFGKMFLDPVAFVAIGGLVRPSLVSERIDEAAAIVSSWDEDDDHHETH